MAGKNRVRTAAKWAVIPVGIAVSGALVLGFSNSAFTASTTNSGNEWASGGGVSLTTNNDVAHLPLFNYKTNTIMGSTNPYLFPNKVITSQIDVTYAGTGAADVRLFATNLGASTSSLSDHLHLNVQDEASKQIFDGTLTQFGAINGWSGASATAWHAPSSGATKTYKFTVTADPTVPENSTVAASDFTWEAQPE